MGCEANFVCITCRKTWYCGYGSYGRMDARLTRAPREEHVGHNTTTFTEDDTHVSDSGDLMMEYPWGDKVLIPGFDRFEKIDASGLPLRK